MKKVSVIISIFIVLISATFSVPKIFSNMKTYKAMSAEEATLHKQISEHEDEINKLKAIIGPEDSIISNTQIAAMVSKINGLELLSIKAQKYNSDYLLEDIVEIDNFDDVSYFTDSIDKMLFQMQVIDLNTALVDIADSSVLFDKIELSDDRDTMYLRVATISMNDNGSQATSSNDTSSLANLEEQATETVKNESEIPFNLRDSEQVTNEINDETINTTEDSHTSLDDDIVYIE